MAEHFCREFRDGQTAEYTNSTLGISAEEHANCGCGEKAFLPYRFNTINGILSIGEQYYRVMRLDEDRLILLDL